MKSFIRKYSKIVLFIMFVQVAFFHKGNCQNAKKTNIILILADDLGYGDLGYTGCKDFKTPSIDRLANRIAE